ncbi:hypothetical protein BSN82_00185 [Acinetobacter baylyi]|nr:hypothetical protein BSL88_12295 [Acinetobacter baylyi]MAK32209.1 hypothetical protein [Acinetobacter sp.]KAF2375733.1 hypothetical protein BSL67_00180 [Acinetobacter baylyi]KAF2377292.1 hypothetical protein BSN81_07970 [Acinetobacter baylyi]KAF2385848.1 hypothetical protein BSN82_00185 [Acinetobacter baylyi]
MLSGVGVQVPPSAPIIQAIQLLVYAAVDGSALNAIIQRLKKVSFIRCLFLFVRIKNMTLISG